jgi:uroporphyrinogen-III decarboxylase
MIEISNQVSWITSRQRLLAALKCQALDRVPISCYGLVGWDLDSWFYKQPSYERLLKLVRKSTDCFYLNSLPQMSFGNPADAVIGSADEVESEIYSVKKWREKNSEFTRKIIHTPKGDLTSLYRRDDDVCTVWALEYPFKSIEDMDRFLSVDWTPANMNMTKFSASQKKLGHNGLLMPTLSDPICIAAELFEMGNFLVNATLDPAKIKYFLDAIHEMNMAYLKTIFEEGKKAGVNWSEVVFRICGPEYATPPYLAPEGFAAFVTPYLIAMSDLIHQNNSWVRVHSHGKVARVLDEIMKCNPDAIDPLEASPDGDIELCEAKRLIGNKCCLCGNLQMKLLELGSPDDVRKAVIQCMQAAKKNGGFVIMPTDAPLGSRLSPQLETNYRVFIETSLEYGRY